MKLLMMQRPTQVICGGMAYAAHNEEIAALFNIKEEIKGFPFYFVKSPRAIIGDGEPIVLPDVSRLTRKQPDPPWGQVTGEVELGIVLKDRVHDLRPEQVRAHILGYTIFNDVTQRDLEVAGYPVGLSKGFATFGPLGPHVVTADELPDPQRLRFQLRVNGKAYQDGSLADMLFTLDTLVALASAIFALERGDVVTSGSPPGMFGYGLQPGDVIEAEIEGIGILRNPVVGPA
jgi:2-keto-4-pentenoate hydratase/2-oxohepta-3-ene-1,7-dioic acid hydratase in catechol pathway